MSRYPGRVFPRSHAEAHLRRLGSRHGIEIVWIKHQWAAEAEATTRQVFIPPPTTALRYLIGLHEFGHLVDKVSARVVVNHYPCAEAAAWSWAKEHADENLMSWMTEGMWRQVGIAWVTSVTDAVKPRGLT